MSLFVHVTVTLRAVQIIGGKENYFVVTGVILCIILNITYSENFGQCLWNHLVILYIYIYIPSLLVNAMLNQSIFISFFK